MKKLASILSFVPKNLVIFTLIAVSVIVPVAVQATDGNTPIFNSFTDTPYSGDERDFLRVGTGGSNSFANTVEACEGEVDLWVYIHNDQESEENGTNYDGPAVAHDTRLAVDLPSGAGTTITPEATITASNASTVNDTATITCNGHEVEIKYVPGSAQIFSADRGYQALSDEVVTNPNGTLVGSFADDGMVPACWDYRIWVTMTVEIEKVEEPEPVYECTALNPIFVDRNTRQLNATASIANGAEVVSYDFNFSDKDNATDTVATSELSATSAEHTYASGSHTASAVVHFDVNGDGEADVSDDCTTPIEIDEEPVYQCVVTTPVVDPNDPFNWTFTTTTSMSDDVSVNKYIYDFGVNGEDAVHSNSNPITKVYEDYGTYDVDVRVVFNVGETQVEDDCGTTVTIEKTPEKPPELPNTGAASLLAGFFGTGALSYTIRGWFTSRGALRKKLLGNK